jgi:hypothetical protein
MNRFEIVVEPFTSLYVGGYAQARRGSDGDTASDAAGLLLPGSAVKGALRESAARLVRGLGHGDELLVELFGGTDKPGLLRVGTLRTRLTGDSVSDGRSESPEDGTIRNHVSLERSTRQAAPQRLFQNRVTPALKGLAFHGVVESPRALDDEELGLLISAVQITDQIGGGRGRGLGLVLMSLTALDVDEPGLKSDFGEETTALVLVLEAEEPLHLSSVKDPSNYVSSKDYLDGSTIRGAVAATLAGLPGESKLELVFGGASPVVFGDGRAGSFSAIPRPMTLEEPKSGGPLTDKAVFLCAEACGGRTMKWPADRRYSRGTVIRGEQGWSTYTVKRRTVTRTARDHASGRAADGKLFSLEVLDPVLDPPASQDCQRLCFYVPVSGDSQQLRPVLQAASAGLAVGGDRSRGFGRLRLVDFQIEPVLEPLAERHARWSELVARYAVPNPEATGVLLAVGSLAVSQQRLTAALAALDLDLIEGVARRNVHGGWNAKIQLSRSLSGHFLPGSTFLVAHRGRRESALDALAAVEKHGIGPGRADGQGRLIACHPIHVDCFKEE